MSLFSSKKEKIVLKCDGLFPTPMCIDNLIEARKCLERGDHEKAFKLYEECSECGDMISWFNLGNCYYYGIGTGRNKDKAIECWMKSVIDDNGICYARKLVNPLRSYNSYFSLSCLFHFQSYSLSLFVSVDLSGGDNVRMARTVLKLNSSISSFGFNLILMTFSKGTSYFIRFLSIVHKSCSVGGEFIQSLVNGLKFNSSLILLDLSSLFFMLKMISTNTQNNNEDNGDSGDGGKSLLSALRGNSTITSLKLSC